MLYVIVILFFVASAGGALTLTPHSNLILYRLTSASHNPSPVLARRQSHHNPHIQHRIFDMRKYGHTRVP